MGALHDPHSQAKKEVLFESSGVRAITTTIRLSDLQSIQD
jgi:hypothetical protein